jgi:RNA polymerase sigma-70 factor, ECF subfamily
MGSPVIDPALSGQPGPVIHELSAPASLSARRDNDRDARLASMLTQHMSVVWRTLKRLGVPAASVDDATQHVFLVASKKLDEIRAGGERRYLLGIAVKVAADARRTLRRRREVPLEDDVHPAAQGRTAAMPEERLDQKRVVAQIVAALDEVPEGVREAFVLFELEELSAPEVAELLEIPVGSVASRVRRARDHIRQRLASDGGKQ